MSARRGATGLRGVLLVDKPAGITSHDVISRVRRATGERRVGHAGTLDPMATGLLVVLVGPFTRLGPYLTAADKTYLARVQFGSETDTDDAEGTIVRTAPIPATVRDESAARETLASLVGESLRIPPVYSAIKVDGRVSHRVARSGGDIELAPRPVKVHRADLLQLDAAEAFWEIDFLVSKGTYIRALARDLGRALDSTAHLSALRRTASGAFSIADAHSLDEIDQSAAAGAIESLFADPVPALALPVLEADARDVFCGRQLPAPEGDSERFAITDNGTLVAVYSRKGEYLVADAVFPYGDGGSS